MLEENKKCQGIWLRDKTAGLVGEIIVSWQSSNVLYGESITVVQEFRRKGLATQLTELMLEWAGNSGFQYFTGEARIGTSWNLYKSMGAVPIFIHKDWNETGEDYMSFKMDI
jgi:GNAT superfamily N-acetyltransferase